MRSCALEGISKANAGLENKGKEVGREWQGADYVWCRCFMGKSCSNSYSKYQINYEVKRQFSHAII